MSRPTELVDTQRYVVLWVSYIGPTPPASLITDRLHRVGVGTGAVCITN